MSKKTVIALTASLIAGTLSVEARALVHHASVGSGHQIRADLVKELPADIIANNDGEGSCGEGSCGGGSKKPEKKVPEPSSADDEEECPGGVCPAPTDDTDEAPDQKWY